MEHLAVFTVLILVIKSFGLPESQPRNLNEFLFNDGFEFVDLTHTFDKNTVYWPDSTNFTFIQKTAGFRENGSWYASNDFCAGEHGGTHLDAPYHFSKNGAHAGEIPLNNLILPLIIADVSIRVNEDPNFVLHKHHLDYMLNNYFGKTEQPCLILFKFGWSKFFTDRQKYLGLNGTSMNFPGISGEVASWITTSYKNVVGVGVDVASVDPGSSNDFAAHKTLLGAGLYVLENVKLDDFVPESSCTGLVLPMKIGRGTGAPLRLAAVCPKTLMRRDGRFVYSRL